MHVQAPDWRNHRSAGGIKINLLPVAANAKLEFPQNVSLFINFKKIAPLWNGCLNKCPECLIKEIHYVVSSWRRALKAVAAKVLSCYKFGRRKMYQDPTVLCFLICLFRYFIYLTSSSAFRSFSSSSWNKGKMTFVTKSIFRTFDHYIFSCHS